jgi:hypothetical protein
MPGNPSRQNLSGPLSGMVSFEIKDVTGLLRNLNAKNTAFVRAAKVVTSLYAERMRDTLRLESPIKFGNMRDLVKVISVSAQQATFSVGWEREDFLSAGLRWYIPYVLLGTSRRPANTVHLRAEAIIRPMYLAALKQALVDETRRA